MTTKTLVLLLLAGCFNIIAAMIALQIQSRYFAYKAVFNKSVAIFFSATASVVVSLINFLVYWRNNTSILLPISNGMMLGAGLMMYARCAISSYRYNRL